MELGTITINLSEDSIKQISNSISVSINQNINSLADVLAKTLAAQLAKYMPQTAVSTSVEQPKTKQTATASKTAGTAPKKAQNTSLVQKIYDTIMEDFVYLDKDFSNLSEVSDMLSKDIDKLTGGVIKVRFGKVRSHILPNFRETECMRAIHAPKWPGYVKYENIISDLTAAYATLSNQTPVTETVKEQHTNTESAPAPRQKRKYTRRVKKNTVKAQHTVLGTAIEDRERDCSTPLGATRQQSKRMTGYFRGSYTRVKPGSKLIRMRRNKKDAYNGPMVIDRDFAVDLIERKLTHVTIKPTTKGSLCLEFTKEDVPTYAPKKNSVISRLHVHAVNTTDKVTPVTCAINGGEFQNTIMKHFNTFVEPGGEAFFKFDILKDSEKNCIIKLDKAL